jgi:hypothetical protein
MAFTPDSKQLVYGVDRGQDRAIMRQTLTAVKASRSHLWVQRPSPQFLLCPAGSWASWIGGENQFLVVYDGKEDEPVSRSKSTT